MHAVPPNLNLSSWHGCALEHIGLGAHNLNLNFEGSHVISCEGLTQMESSDGTVTVYSRHGWGDVSPLTALLGASVTSWRVEGTHEFSLSFSSGHKLRFTSEEGPYEDFVIDGGVCVV
jgi:hypothetical protein